MFKNNDIVITSHTNKINLLNELNTSLTNIKIYTLEEFKHLYYFNYDEKTIFYIMNKYHVIYEIAKIYLDNMYYLEDKKYRNKKLSFLLSLKEELLAAKLLYFNPLFKEYLKSKHIIIFNLPQNKELDNLINSLKSITEVTIASSSSDTYPHQVYKLNNDIEEVEFIANKICELVNRGVPFSNIYLTNLNSDYKKSIKRIFPMFNIPFTLNVDETIFATAISTKFFAHYDSDLSKTISLISEDATNDETKNIINKIISIINKYTFVDDKLLVKDMIKYDFLHTKLDGKEIPNSIHEVDLKNTIFKDTDYVFTINFTQGILPSLYKDEEYLTDSDKEELSISYTIDKNNLEKDIIASKLNNIKNLFLTFPTSSNGESLTISSLNDTLKYEVITPSLPHNYSNLYNKIKLTSCLDEFYKYGTVSSLLKTLTCTYPSLPYNVYDNKFTGLNPTSVFTYLNNKLTLSYSSLDKYYRCPFSYYITKILKLDIFDYTFPIAVGTLFHAILEKQNTTTLSYDELWEEELSNIDYEFSIKDRFFLRKLKKELSFIIDTIKEQEECTELHDELHEEEVNTIIDANKNITFTGIIDKIKYQNSPTGTIAAIIDYKTGHPNLDLTTLPYGIGMQLPVYLYLAHNSDKLKDVKIAGFYLQKILNNEITVDNTHTYLELKKKNLLLQGYSNSDPSIISIFDTTYDKSNMVAGLRLKNDGNFYSTSKVLSTAQMDILVNEAETRIKQGAKLITDAEFSIAPKVIGTTNYGCNLCKYKDICYRTNNDLVNLEAKDLKDIIGGEE